jgi:hypothetical protein
MGGSSSSPRTVWTMLIPSLLRSKKRRRNSPRYAIFFPSSFQCMSRIGGQCMGYLHSQMDRSRTSAGACHIVTRLAARSVTGHTLPIQVYQHCGWQFHLVLRGRSCLRRDCSTKRSVRRACDQLERGLDGVHSCVFDDTRESPDWVEPCLVAEPLRAWLPPGISKEYADLWITDRWMCKIEQQCYRTQEDVCCCSTRGHIEEMG